MKAIEWTAYGEPDVLKLIEADKPSPKNNEVRVKVHASTVTSGDCRLRSLNTPKGLRFATRLALGISKPRKLIPGMEFSDEIESIGRDVSEFKVGDRIFGTTEMQLGAHAEYLCTKESSALIKIPNELSYKDAVSLIFGGFTAIHFLKDKVTINSGDKVLINGVSGSVGCASIQIAKTFGANVTAICSSKNHDLVKSLGADKMIDYTAESFCNNGENYDIILDTVGDQSFNTLQSSLTASGKALLITSDLSTIFKSLINKRLITGVAAESKASLGLLLDLVKSQKLTSVIDREFPLEQILEAHRYVDKGHKKGNVVLMVVNQ
ncbi:MAG: NADPH:quinone reductase-like Zn-dependent oxidoreductase [Cocleimonas sp.]|jgi:NADPH:quinone reductase-like Zn-dependent oxidoreductase